MLEKRPARGRCTPWLLVVALGGFLPRDAHAQSCTEPTFALPTTVSVGTNPESVALADVDRDGKLDLVATNLSSGNVSVGRGQGDGTFLAVTNFAAGSLPYALAVADLNRDGRPDIVVSNNIVAGATVSVLLATGAAGNFGAATSFPVGSLPTDLAVGDLDGDGRLDLAVVNANAASVSILLGDGLGAFSAGTPLTGLNGPIAVAIADFDRDGKSDLAVVERGLDRVAVFRGTGGAAFGAPLPFAVGDQPEFVIAADFNRDGNPDLAVSSDGALPKGVNVLLGDGSGGFGAATLYPSAFSSYRLVAADFNRDGILDIADAENGTPWTTVFLGRGDGSFDAPTTITTGSSSVGVAAGDLNGDGRPDLAVTVPTSNSVAVALNQTGLNCPNLSLGPAARTFATNVSPVSVAKGDFNDDGRLDAVAVSTSSNTLSILLNDGMGGFGTASIIGTGGTSPKHAVAADFNGDGKLDLAVTNILNVAILLGNGAGGFGGPAPISLSGTPGALAAGDLNGDGKVDLAVSLGSAGQVAILLGTGTGTFTGPTNVPVAGANLTGLALGDFNGDGTLDLVVTDLTSDAARLLPGTGTGTFGPPASFAVGNDPRSVAVADFDRDGKLDFATANSTSNDVSVRRGDGLGSFGPLLNLAVGTSPQSVAVADLDGDGKPDLVAGGSSLDIALLRGDGAGGFGPAAFFPAPGSPLVSVVGDFNRDGWDDVLSANGFGSAVMLFLGDGAGGLLVAPRFGVGTTPRSTLAADFNRDGKLDLAVSNFGSGNVTILGGNGDGTFTSGDTLSASANSWGLATGDFDRDGKPDLAVAGFGDDKVRLFLGVGDGTFTTGNVLDSATRPIAIAVGDLDRDGLLDLVVANVSSNDVRVFIGDGLGGFIALTPVPTGGTSPADVAVGDVNRDGILDVVTPNQASDDFWVMTGRGDGTFNAPARFTTGFQPTAVALGDLDRSGTLDVVVADQVSNHVAVYRGNGSGGFTFVNIFATGRLPSDVALADFNADGKLDVVAASADYGSASVLLGDGSGNFASPFNYGTGSGSDAVAVGDFNRDGKPDFATSVPASAAIAVVLNTSCRPRRLVVTTDAPACVTPAGTVLSPALALRVVDDGTNLQQCGAAPVTASIVPGTGAAGALLSGTNPVTTVSGVATFSNLSVNLEGRRYVLDFFHPLANAAHSRPFTQVAPVSILGPSEVCGSSGTWTSGPGYDSYNWKLDAVTVATTDALNLTGLIPGPHVLELTCTQDTCPTLASLPITVTATLSGVSIAPPSPTSVCASCTGVTLTETHTGGGTVAWQWGFRTVSLGPITAIPGQTSQSYGLNGADFPGPGTYYVVVTTTPACGSPAVSNEVQVVVTVPASEAQFFTVTSADLTETLEWVYPSVSGNVRIRFNSGLVSCTFPTDVDGLDGSTLLANVSGVPGARGSFVHDAVSDPLIANDTHYCFTLWVNLGGSVFSAGRTNRGRPFSTGGPVKWAFSLGTVALTPPGNGALAVHVVGMDNSVHAARKGVGGGTWPLAPDWIPRSMNGPSQGRPTAVPVTVGSANPVLFLGSQDGHVYAFDAQTGASAWSPSSPALGNVVQAGPSGIFTTFGGAFDYILVGTRDGGLANRFYALKPSDGTVVWSYDGNDGVVNRGKIGIVSGQAAVDYVGKRVYFASRAFGAAPDNNTLWCFDLALQRACWAQAYDDIDGGVTLRGDRLYVGTTTGAVLAVNTSDGTLGWSVAPAPLDGPVKGYVTADRLTDDLYFATSTRLWSLSDTGPTSFSHNWSPTGVPFTNPSTPIYAPGDTLVYVGGNGRLSRLSVVDGSEVDFFTLGDGPSIVGSPTLDVRNGFAYVGTAAGVVFAIQLP